MPPPPSRLPTVLCPRRMARTWPGSTRAAGSSRYRAGLGVVSAICVTLFARTAAGQVEESPRAPDHEPAPAGIDGDAQTEIAPDDAPHGAGVVTDEVAETPQDAREIAVYDEDATDLGALSLDELLEVRVDSITKRRQLASDADAVLQVITREDIARYGYVTLRELFANIPFFYQVDDYEDVDLGVRGAIGGGIQFLLNGVPLHPVRASGLTMREPGRLNVPIEAIDRIEIVRGPMSVIYGNNAFSGTVNIVTNDPDTAVGMASAGAGPYGFGRGFVRAGRRFEGGAAVVNAGFLATDGNGGRLEDSMSAGQLASLPPGSLTDLRTAFSHRDFAVDASATLADLTVEARFSSMRYGMYPLLPPMERMSRLNRDDAIVAATYLHRFSEALAIRGVGIYSHESYGLSVDAIVPDSIGVQNQRSRRAEVEINLLASMADRLEATVGVRAQHMFGIQNAISIPQFGLLGRRHATPFALYEAFAQANVRLVGSLQLTGGARLTRRSRSQFTRIEGPDEDSLVRTDSRVNATTTLVPSLGLLYRHGDHHGLKSVFGQAVQNPEFGGGPLERNTTVQFQYTLSLQQVSLEATLFRSDTRHLYRVIQDVDPVTMMTIRRSDASGRLLSYGAELDIRFVPVTGLSLDASFTYVNTRDVANGIRPGESPRMTGQTRVSYTFHDVTFSAFAHYVGGMRSDWQWTTTPDVWVRRGDAVDAYLSLGANVRYDHDRSGIFLVLHGSNLVGTDIRYPANELVDWQGGAFGPRRTLFGSFGIQR